MRLSAVYYVSPFTRWDWYGSLECLIFGTCEVSIKYLNAVLSAPSELVDGVEVVCPPDKKAGRGRRLRSVPLKRFALENGLKVYDAPRSVRAPYDEWNIPRCGFDLGIVSSFGYFLPREVIESFPVGAINAHPSLLLNIAARRRCSMHL